MKTHFLTKKCIFFSYLKHFLEKKRLLEWSTIRTSSAGSATLGDTSWARLTTKLTRCLRIGTGTPHISIWNIWSDVQTRVVTPHKFSNTSKAEGGWGGHRTFQLRLSCQMINLGWGHRIFLLRTHSCSSSLTWPNRNWSKTAFIISTSTARSPTWKMT